MPFSAGRPETLCGAGSMLANTTSIRAWLPRTLQELGVKTLLDAPCGDFNWMSRADLSMIDYIGVDYDEQHVAAANARQSEPVEYAPHSKVIMLADAINDRLPRCDAVLCRDFLQHLPTKLALATLRNMTASGAGWLLATSHDVAVNGEIDRPGEFRPLNLMAMPFNLPPPDCSVADGAGRILGVWNLETRSD